MADIWEPSQRATCVHSGWPLIPGYANVLESWSYNFQDICVEHIVVRDAHAVIHHGGVGWVYCKEYFDSLYWSGHLSSFEARATNIFVESDGGWRMVYHHSAGSVRQQRGGLRPPAGGRTGPELSVLRRGLEQQDTEAASCCPPDSPVLSYQFSVSANWLALLIALYNAFCQDFLKPTFRFGNAKHSIPAAPVHELVSHCHVFRVPQPVHRPVRWQSPTIHVHPLPRQAGVETPRPCRPARNADGVHVKTCYRG